MDNDEDIRREYMQLAQDDWRVLERVFEVAPTDSREAIIRRVESNNSLLWEDEDDWDLELAKTQHVNVDRIRDERWRVVTACSHFSGDALRMSDSIIEAGYALWKKEVEARRPPTVPLSSGNLPALRQQHVALALSHWRVLERVLGVAPTDASASVEERLTELDWSWGEPENRDGAIDMGKSRYVDVNRSLEERWRVRTVSIHFFGYVPYLRMPDDIIEAGRALWIKEVEVRQSPSPASSKQPLSPPSSKSRPPAASKPSLKGMIWAMGGGSAAAVILFFGTARWITWTHSSSSRSVHTQSTHVGSHALSLASWEELKSMENPRIHKFVEECTGHGIKIWAIKDRKLQPIQSLDLKTNKWGPLSFYVEGDLEHPLVDNRILVTLENGNKGFVFPVTLKGGTKGYITVQHANKLAQRTYKLREIEAALEREKLDHRSVSPGANGQQPTP